MIHVYAVIPLCYIHRVSSISGIYYGSGDQFESKNSNNS